MQNIKIEKDMNNWEEAVFEAGKILEDNGYIKRKIYL